MQTERTFGFIKPDATRKNNIGEIIDRAEKNGLTIVGLKMLHLTEEQASHFYDIHKDKPFFDSLVKFMTSGPVVAMVFEGVDAINRWRQIMGATNPQNAAPGTIRSDFAESIDENAVHGSDAAETAAREIACFFKESDLCPRSELQDHHS